MFCSFRNQPDTQSRVPIQFEKRQLIVVKSDQFVIIENTRSLSETFQTYLFVCQNIESKTMSNKPELEIADVEDQVSNRSIAAEGARPKL